MYRRLRHYRDMALQMCHMWRLLGQHDRALADKTTTRACGVHRGRTKERNLNATRANERLEPAPAGREKRGLEPCATLSWNISRVRCGQSARTGSAVYTRTARGLREVHTKLYGIYTGSIRDLYVILYGIYTGSYYLREFLNFRIKRKKTNISFFHEKITKPYKTWDPV